MSDPIPAIREDQATSETAAVFADMRATLGVPFVNLIWRHLATMPGMLAWTWSVVKPMHATASLPAAGQGLRASVRMPPGLQQPPAVFDAAGVSAADRTVIRALLEDYGAANAVNLLSLLLVGAVLAGETPGGHPDSPGPPERTGAASPASPPLPGWADLPHSLRDLVLDLDQFGRSAPTDAVASLYRHLAHWPGFLAVTRAALSAGREAGHWRAEHERIRAAATATMRDRLLRQAAVPPPPPTTGRAEAAASINAFTGQMIARMVVMGEAMLALLPPERL